MAFKFRERLAQTKKKSLSSCCEFMGLLLYRPSKTKLETSLSAAKCSPGVLKSFILVKAYLEQNYYLCRLNKNKNAK